MDPYIARVEDENGNDIIEPKHHRYETVKGTHLLIVTQNLIYHLLLLTKFQQLVFIKYHQSFIDSST